MKDNRRVDHGGKRLRQLGNVLTGDDTDHAGAVERGGGVDAGDAGRRMRRADHGGVVGARHGVEVVDEAPAPAQQGLVLDALQRLPHPGHAPNPTRPSSRERRP